MSTLQTVDRRSSSIRQVSLFFAATYLFSWSCFGIGQRLEFMPLILLGIWGPSLTALAMVALHHGVTGIRQMLSRFGRVRAAPHWWLLMLLLPGAVHFVGRGVWGLLSVGEIDTTLWFSLGTLIGSFLIAGLGEELGWRGFALPRLQQHVSPLGASLVLAVAHFFWHLPTYWLGQGIHNVPMIYAFAFIIPWTIIFTWIYNRSGGSLLFAVGFHAISNTSLAVVRFMPLDGEVAISPSLITQLHLPAELSGPYLAVVAVYWVVAAVVVIMGGLEPANTDTP